MTGLDMCMARCCSGMTAIVAVGEARRKWVLSSGVPESQIRLNESAGGMAFGRVLV